MTPPSEASEGPIHSIRKAPSGLIYLWREAQSFKGPVHVFRLTLPRVHRIDEVGGLRPQLCLELLVAPIRPVVDGHLDVHAPRVLCDLRSESNISIPCLPAWTHTLCHREQTGHWWALCRDRPPWRMLNGILPTFMRRREKLWKA